MPRQKLTPEQIDEVNEKLKEICKGCGGMKYTMTYLAEYYGVSVAVIRHVASSRGKERQDRRVERHIKGQN